MGHANHLLSIKQEFKLWTAPSVSSWETLPYLTNAVDEHRWIILLP